MTRKQLKQFAIFCSVILLCVFVYSAVRGQDITIYRDSFTYSRVDPNGSNVVGYAPVMITSSDSVQYEIPVVNLTNGSIEFWVYPHLSGEVLAFVFNSTDTVTYSTSSWNLGWHHIMACWTYEGLNYFYVDGSRKTGNTEIYPTESQYGRSNLNVYEIDLPKTSLLAVDLGLASWQCVDSLYNQGDGRDVGVTQYNRLSFAKDYSGTCVGFPDTNVICDVSFDSTSSVSRFKTINISVVKDDSITKNGDYSLKLQGDGVHSQGVVADTLLSAFSSDSSFAYSFWHTTMDGDSCKFVVYPSTNSSEISSAGWLSVSDSTYRYYEGTFSKPDDSEKIALHYYAKGATDTVWFDGITVIPLENDNSDFETFSGDVPVGWNTTGSVVVDTGTTSHTGTYAWEITNSNASNYVYTDVTVSSGDWYTVQGFLRIDTGVGYVKLSQATTKTILCYLTGAYDKFAYSFKAVTSTLRIVVYASSQSSTVLIDDFQVFKLDVLTSTVKNVGNYIFSLDRAVIME